MPSCSHHSHKFQNQQVPEHATNHFEKFTDNLYKPEPTRTLSTIKSSSVFAEQHNKLNGGCLWGDDARRRRRVFDADKKRVSDTGGAVCVPSAAAEEEAIFAWQKEGPTKECVFSVARNWAALRYVHGFENLTQ